MISIKHSRDITNRISPLRVQFSTCDCHIILYIHTSEVEITFLICQDKMSRQFQFWLDISRIWLDKFSGPIMIIIIMKGTKVLTFSASNFERMTLKFSTVFLCLNLHLRLSL